VNPVGSYCTKKSHLLKNLCGMKTGVVRGVEEDESPQKRDAVSTGI